MDAKPTKVHGTNTITKLAKTLRRALSIVLAVQSGLQNFCQTTSINICLIFVILYAEQLKTFSKCRVRHMGQNDKTVTKVLLSVLFHLTHPLFYVNPD